MEQDGLVLYRAVGHNEREQILDTRGHTIAMGQVHPAPPTDLESLVRRHIPRDTNQKITDFMVDRWVRLLGMATGVTVERVEEHGRRLQASWLDRDGNVVASIGYPAHREGMAREFVRDWERLMRQRGEHPQVSWDDEAGPELNGTASQ